MILVFRTRAREINPDVLYLSQLKPIEAQQEWPEIDPVLLKREGRTGYEQIKRDLSSDGRQIQIGKTVYRFGLGAHAHSRIEYDIPGDYTLFDCFIGVDAEVLPIYEEMPDRGTVRFYVWVNGILKYESPLILPTTPPRRVAIPIPKKEQGVNQLILEVSNAGDWNHSDHADWAMARVIKTVP